MIIDAHQHFWQLDRGDYGWLTPELEPLYRDFLPSDLAPILDRSGVGGTILVQAAPTLAETEFMLDLARATPFVLGVVGWVDFAASDAEAQIDRLASDPYLVGLRPMIQDIDDDDWMLRADLRPAFRAMVRNGLVFDALVLPRHLPRLNRLCQEFPHLSIVIDHGAKPAIAQGIMDDWRAEMAALARYPNVSCKLSGLVTEAGAGWTSDAVIPYAAELVRLFGPDRLIWGSDWPVQRMATGYDDWLILARSLVAETDREAIFTANAVRIYRLQLSA